MLETIELVYFNGMAPEDYYNKHLARGWTRGLAQELKILQGMPPRPHRAGPWHSQSGGVRGARHTSPMCWPAAQHPAAWL